MPVSQTTAQVISVLDEHFNGDKDAVLDLLADRYLGKNSVSILLNDYDNEGVQDDTHVNMVMRLSIIL